MCLIDQNAFSCRAWFRNYGPTMSEPMFDKVAIDVVAD